MLTFRETERYESAERNDKELAQTESEKQILSRAVEISLSLVKELKDLS